MEKMIKTNDLRRNLLSDKDIGKGFSKGNKGNG